MKTSGASAPSFQVKGVGSLFPGQVHQVVATYDGSNLRLYVDGVLNGTSPATGSLDYSGIGPQTGLAIGGALGSTEPIFAGAISDVSIYAAALSATTIEQHYTVGNAEPATPAPLYTPNFQAYPALVAAGKPIAYYPLNDSGATMKERIHKLDGVYGANVRHGGPALTSSGDTSALFAGSAVGANPAPDIGMVPANRAFYSAATITVEAWVRPLDYNRTGAIEPILSYGEESIGSVWSLELTAQSRLSFSVKVNGGAGSYLLVSSVPLLPAQTSQVVASYDGSALRLYVNGALIASMPATGALNYLGVPPQDALAIGGAAGGNLPAFAGAINDVSIYPSALTADVIESHYLTGNLVSILNETPKSSDAFVDTIGVVTHLLNAGTPYVETFATFETLLKASGIRHIGDALVATPAWYPAEIQQLAADGVHATLVTALTQTPQAIATAIPLFANAVESIGGPNEPDDAGNPNWVAQTRAFQQMLWSTVKSNPATAQLTVLGPSLTNGASYPALGDLSAYLDAGAMHDYFDGYNPGTTGWGSLHAPGIYGSISYNLNLLATVSGAKPIIATETGYGDSPTDSGGVDDGTLARYVPRLYLEHFLHGVLRSTIYEFYDAPGTGDFTDFGLVRQNNAPKPSYYAIKSLIGALADPGSAFTTTPLTYVLAGNVNSLHHLLLQKRDGTYELALWLETLSYNPSTKVDIAVPQQAINLKLGNAAAVATISTIGDSGSLQSAALPLNDGAATLMIDDHVTILSFK
jgi:hypothetical protein